MRYDDILGTVGRTPVVRLDRLAPSPAAPEPALIAAETAAYVDEVVHDAAQPVVLFALEWREFCWSLRRLLTRLRICAGAGSLTTSCAEVSRIMAAAPVLGS